LIQGLEKTILFDTGTRGPILLHNISRLGVDLEKVDQIVLSHDHGDHTGGLTDVLEKNKEVSVYIPSSFSKEIFSRVENAGAEIVTVKGPVEICKNVFSTGEMGAAIIEQSLVLDTDKGLIVITGCAHPGIVDIIRKAREIRKGVIRCVFGGFHLLRKSDQEIHVIIKQFKDIGVEKVGATHCTGDRAIELFQRSYGDNFVQMGVGKILRFSH
jgi:7,8-dihydropterin-6-yl-methyl-4-(beta-D-ribofuranosyl)aminobenzene 5'-phosphate synthase